MQNVWQSQAHSTEDHAKYIGENLQWLATTTLKLTLCIQLAVKL